MKTPKYHQECHKCAPKDWRKVRNITGDYDFDASMQKSPANGNKDAEAKLTAFVGRGRRGR